MKKSWLTDRRHREETMFRDADMRITVGGDPKTKINPDEEIKLLKKALGRVDKTKMDEVRAWADRGG
jgi:hypothetical protein